MSLGTIILILLILMWSVLFLPGRTAGIGVTAPAEVWAWW